MGFAWGALLTFSAVERGAIEQASKHKFRAAAAFYPLCGSYKGIMTIPTLILIGERDAGPRQMPAAKWLLAKMIWGFPDRRAKVPRFGSSSIPTRISRLPFRPFRRRPSISGITWSSTNQPLINRAKRSVNFSTQQLGAVSNLSKRCQHHCKPNVRYGSRPCENVFPPPKTAGNWARSTSTRPSEHIFAVSSLESIRAQPRTMLSDLNGHTARTTVHAPHARIAARSGLIPTMFITRVRL